MSVFVSYQVNATGETFSLVVVVVVCWLLVDLQKAID